MSSRFSHALLFVADLERMIAFYSGVFALAHEATAADDGFVFLRGRSGGDLALHRLPPHVLSPLATPPAWREDCASKLCFAVDDLASARQRLLDHGGQAKEPWTWEGRTLCECCDPEGNVIQLYR